MLNNILVLLETYTNGYASYSLDIISILAILFAISVILVKNPIVSVLYLIGLFGCISIYLIMCGFSFIGLAYLIVYIGAVSILFLFILMLLDIRISELQNNNKKSIPLIIVISVFIFYPLIKTLPFNIYDENLNWKMPIFFVSSNGWDGNLGEHNHMTAIGNIMYTNYNIWLFLASFILLLAMTGAIVITIRENTSTNHFA
jgi:NADH-ubiquinone oxidoreductase chain 6